MYFQISPEGDQLTVYLYVFVLCSVYEFAEKEGPVEGETKEPSWNWKFILIHG